MKIAIVCRRYFPEIGGVETHVKEIAERLSREHDVVVFTLTKKKGLPVGEIINNVKVKRFKSLKLSFSLEFPPKSMIHEIEKFNPDIINSHNAHTTIPYYVSKVKCKCKFVITPHYVGNATSPFRKILAMVYKPLLNTALNKADRIICVSSIESEMLTRNFALNGKKITIIPNGVGSDLIGIASRNMQKELRILSVGRFDLHHKKTDKLIRALKILESKKIDAKLVLIGSGPDTQKMIDLINSLDLVEKIELKTNLTREELVEEYGKASIFVTASEQEAFGIAVAEALAARLRVVVPNSTALSLFVNAGYASGIETPVTPSKVAEAIINCLQNDAQSTEYTPYTWDMATRDLDMQYKELFERTTQSILKK